MRILSFKVSGYANFTESVAVAPLEELNVLYGPNNAGKSNLLRALELYFRLLGISEGVTRQPVQRVENPDPALAELLAGAFHRTDPQPIQFLVNWSVPPSELERWSIYSDVPCSQVTTELELKVINRAYELHVLKWMLKDQDVSSLDRSKEAALIQFAEQVRRLLSDATPFQREKPVAPFRIAASQPGFPDDLANALFDARQSLQPEERKRWSLFSRLAASLEPELGPGAWDTAFDRRTGQAALVYVSGEAALPVRGLGAGIQRYLSLLGDLILSREPWVGLEEPEWRLSPELQQRFVSVASRVLEAGVGARQLFITTQSPVLGNSGKPFALELKNGVPMVEGRPWAGESVAGKKEPSLSGLIGLVEELAEIDPEQISAAAPPSRQWAAARA